MLGVLRVDKHDKYLGLPMEVSYSKLEAFGFLKERVRKKLQGWREKTLSAAGKEVLLKAVVQSIPTYIMSCFELPKQLCNEMHQLMARFWWGAKGDEHKIHWLAWEKLCSPKDAGGLGFRNLYLFNLSLLAKQGWRLLTQPHSLAARVFKARYFPYTNFLHAPTGGDMSYMWRSILSGREVLTKGLRYQIGNGNKVSIWFDPWLPTPFSFKPFSLPMEGTISWKVNDLIDPECHEWLQPVIHELFTNTEAQCILRIPLSLRPMEDRLIWHYDRKGLFSVKSGYYTVWLASQRDLPASSSGGCENHTSNPWRSVWKARVPPKIKSFMWRVLRGILPTRMALAKKITLPNKKCVFCNRYEETDLHLFKHCQALISFWNASPLGQIPLASLNCSLSDWICEVLSTFSSQQIDLFLSCLWVVWTERNNVVWKNHIFCPVVMASWAVKLLEEFQKLHPNCSKGKKRTPSRWVCPPRGRLKVNVDGAFNAQLQQGGIGVVVRDGNGICVAAFARFIPHASSALHVEAEALRAGILIAIQEDWMSIELESDCASLISALYSSCIDCSEIGRIVEDCRDYMSSISSANLCHIYREANGVAHRLAHLASVSYVDDLWLNETPSIIEDVLFEDLCKLNRGFGSMSPSKCHL